VQRLIDATVMVVTMVVPPLCLQGLQKALHVEVLRKMRRETNISGTSPQYDDARRSKNFSSRVIGPSSAAAIVA
jgi:hypothetical protein